MKKLYILIIGFYLCFPCSCKKNAIGNIELGTTLVQNQKVDKNKELIGLISQALKEDKSSIQKLIDFPCGGGAGCYDLGFVLTQLVYEIGEDKFCGLIRDFDKKTLNDLQGFIDVGLLYGHGIKNNSLENEFVALRKIIKQGNENIEF